MDLSQLKDIIVTYGSWGGFASLCLYMFFTRNNRMATTTAIEIDTALKLIEKLNEQVDKLERKIDDLEEVIKHKEFTIKDLAKQIELINAKCPQCPLKDFKPSNPPKK